MKPRSPVLGYNHNVRYAQMSWHVQTEDSGVQNPHIFTHLFHDGTILATKKIDYDPSSDVTTVQKLMQAQHKLMLRELKAGNFDKKIIERYGPLKREASDTDKAIPAQPAEPVAPDASAQIARSISESMAAISPPAPAAPPVPPRSPQDDISTVRDLTPMLTPPPAHPPTAAAEQRVRATEAARRPSLTPARPAISVTARTGSATQVPAQAARTGTTGQVPAQPQPPTVGRPRIAPPPTIGSGRSGAAQTNRPTAEGVIVGRPTVIVGKEQGKQREAADFWKTERRAPPDPAFGADLISEKSLDEVILAYLSEDAPKK